MRNTEESGTTLRDHNIMGDNWYIISSILTNQEVNILHSMRKNETND